MFSRIQSKLGTAGLVVAIVALVAALGGGAYAAQQGLNSKQKKEVKTISKQVAKPGPEGKQGPAGPAGAKGDTGAKGDNGSPGTNGTDGEDGMCTAGNPACELPSNSELVGVWSTSGGAGKEEHRDISLTPISFDVRVSPAPTALWAFENGGFTFGAELHDGSASIFGPFSNPESLEDAEADQEAWEEACPGNANAPAAAPGFLCIYNGKIEGASTPFEAQGLAEAANEYGIVVPWKVGDGEYAKGSWAVTAE